MTIFVKSPSPSRAASALPTRVGAVLVGILLSFIVIVFGAATGAHAHDELTGSAPADGATLSAVPTEITLTFSAIILGDGGATQVAISDPSGQAVAEGPPISAGEIVTQAITPGTASEGTYTVLWKVVSGDGHPISGTLTFHVGAASTPDPTASGAPETGSDVSGVLWAVGGIVVVVVLAILVYALVRRARGRTEG